MVLGHVVRVCGLASIWLVGSARPCTGQLFSVDPQPVRTIEGTTREGVPVFGVVIGATRLRDGTIVVADRSANALKFFAGSGEPAMTVGREGEGPGEFELLAGVAQCLQDSLFAFDASHRISVFSTSGRFVRRFAVPGSPGSGPVVCSRAGTLGLAQRRVGAQPSEGGTRLPLTWSLLVADAGGHVTQEYGEVQVGEVAVSAGHSPLPLLGGSLPRIAVTRRRLVLCPIDPGAIGAYSLAGGRLPPIPLRASPRAPSRQDLERAADELVARLPRAVRETMRQRLLRVPPPAHLPPCSDILADPDDNVWVVLSFPGDSVTTLRVFGPDDRMLGDVSIPAALHIREIGSDYLLASGETPEGEPWVRMYRLRRSRAR